MDAKYRDLWEKYLPREMLYQLAVYAISHYQRPESTILYPATDLKAKEARIDVTDPIHGGQIGRVCLRHASLERMESLVNDLMTQGRYRRQSYARRLTFGA